MSIQFGTSGWRAIIADEFTFSNVGRISRAIAKYIKEHRLQNKGIIIGYDTRFLSRNFANACAENLAKNNIKVFLTSRDTPTPVIAFHILKKKTAGAINITASHNPPEYNGIKFSPAYGGPAPIEVTREIERNITTDGHRVSNKRGAQIQIFDPRPMYLARIKQLVGFKAIRQANLRIGVDVLYGTARGYLDKLLEDEGCKVFLLHDRIDHSFGGLPPEPAEKQLRELINLVKSKHLHLGLALDGDADRFGIVDRDGIYINANQVIGLLTAHLIKTRPKQKCVARTVATTHMVDALAKKARMEVVETPVGFKYIGQELIRGGCLIGGEESGGLSIAGHIPEKDGILACLLITEMVAIKRKSLSEILKELYKEVGTFLTARRNYRLSQEEKMDFSRKIKLIFRNPASLDKGVVRCMGLDGYKFIFADKSWLMFRLSGTEPMVRCYCEASSKARLKYLQNLGQTLIKE